MSNHHENRGGFRGGGVHRPGGRFRSGGVGRGQQRLPEDPEVQDSAWNGAQGQRMPHQHWNNHNSYQKNENNASHSHRDSDSFRGRRNQYQHRFGRTASETYQHQPINQRNCNNMPHRSSQPDDSNVPRSGYDADMPLSNFFNFNNKPQPVIPPNLMPAVEDNDTSSFQARNYVNIKSDDNTDYVEKYKIKVEEDLKAAKLGKQSRSAGFHRDRRHRVLDSDGLRSETSIMGSCLPESDRELNHGGDDPEVFWKYDMKKKVVDTGNLLINMSREAILAALVSHQVIIVEGFTGCGKTTQVPQFILDAAAETNSRCKIIVTQPRRIAAISVANRVVEERGWKIGGLVGYQVGMSRCVSEDTRVTYVTTGVLLNLLISRRNLREYTHIIIDEVHERDLDTDLVLLVIKKLMIDQVDRSTKVILMSATLNAEKFSNYFPVWEDTINESAIIRVTQPSMHQIHEFYMDELKHFAGTRAFDMDGSEEPKLYQDCCDAACQIIEALDTLERDRFLNFDKTISEVGNLEKATPRKDIEVPPRGGIKIERGAVLIFLPGLMEIDQMFKQLSEVVAGQFKPDVNELRCETDKFKWSILPLHSSITSEEQQKVFLPVKPGYRKIILATNIAESSITVPDVKYVIDFCLTKSLSCDPATNYTCLRMEWASKYQCVQRRGRCGRVSDGFCFRLVTKKFYSQMYQEALPEMEKASLEAVVLQVKILNMGSPEEILAIAIDPPKLSGIGRAVANLKEVGALTLNVGGRYSKYDGDLTYMGKVMARLPIDIRFGRLIMLGLVFGVLDECVVIAAGLSTKSVFSYPFHKRLDAYLSKLEWSNNSFSDCFCILTAFDTWSLKCKGYEFNSFGDERSWAKTYFLQLTVLREISTLVTEVKHRLDSLGIVQNPTQLNSTDRGFTLKIVIAGAFYPNYFIRSKPNKKEHEKEVMKEVGGNNPMNTVVFQGFPIEQPGELYAKLIATPLTSELSAPRVKFNASRVFVSFDPRGDKIGPICHGVYRSIKMRMLREKICFYTLGRDRSAKELDNALNKIKTKRVRYTPVPPELPSVRVNSMECFVVHVESPSEFWVLNKEEAAKPEIVQLERVMRVDEGCLKPLSDELMDIGRLVIVQRSGTYFRGRIEVIKRGDDNKRRDFELLVYLIDHGARLWRSPGHVFDLTQKMTELKIYDVPARALQVRLEGVKPTVKNGGIWSREAKTKFEELLGRSDNMLTLKIYSVVDGVIVGHLVCRKTKQIVNQELIDGGYADEAHEPRPSQENHDARRLWKNLRYDGKRIEALDAQQAGGWLYDRYLDPPNVKEEDGTLVALRGPNSPLEMNFSSQCRSAHLKQVTVEGNSINCVALDQDPFNPCARMLVAAAVGIAQRSGNIMARDTTMMPAIPGLPALLTMAFCPQLEFRVDDSQSRYTGCLSGLGLDPNVGMAVYPDHDMELIFDTVIDNEDVRSVNSIRLAMNTLLRDSTVGSREIENLRVKVRREFMALLQREREPVKEEVWPNQPHSWGQLPDMKPLDGMFHRKERYSADVFQILRGVELLDSVEDEGFVPRNVFQSAPAPF